MIVHAGVLGGCTGHLVIIMYLSVRYSHYSQIVLLLPLLMFCYAVLPWLL